MKIFDPKLTGSIEIQNTITGNVTIAGGLTVEGSLGGGITGSATASYVEYSNIANKPTLLSGSSQIASDISGSFTSVSSSLASRVESQEAFSSSLDATFATDAQVATAVSSLNAASSSYLLNTSDTLTGNLTVTGIVKADSSSTGDYVRLYGSSGTGQWDIYGNGENLRFSENSGGGGSVVIDNKVGIGVSPNYPFHISSTSVYQAAIKSTGAQYLLLGSEDANGAGIIFDGDSNGDGAGGDYSYIVHENSGVLKIVQDSPAGTNQISFGTAGTENKVIIDTNGNLGVGATTLAYRTEVAGNNGAYWGGSSFTGGTPLALSINNTQNGGYDSVLLFQQTDSGGTVKNAGGIGMVGKASWTAGNDATQISDMYFLVRNSGGGVSERMRIGTDGALGLNTTFSGINTRSLLNIKASSTEGNQIYLVQSNDDRGWRLKAKTDGHFYLDSAHTSTDSNVLVARFDTGRVGIGITSPFSRLHIAAPDPSTDFNLIDFRNNGGYGIYAKTNSIASRGQTLEFMAVDYNLGGTVLTREALCLRPEGNVGIGTPSPSEKLEVNGAIRVNNYVSADQNYISYNQRAYYTDTWRKTSSGRARQLQMGEDNSGTLEYRISNVAGGSAGDAISWTSLIKFPDTGGITFNGDTAAANALDDYEEGTWTPNGFNPRTGWSASGASASGKYTKIGNMVYCQVDIAWADGTATIVEGDRFSAENLPFASSGGTIVGVGNFWIYENFSSGINAYGVLGAINDTGFYGTVTYVQGSIQWDRTLRAEFTYRVS